MSCVLAEDQADLGEVCLRGAGGRVVHLEHQSRTRGNSAGITGRQHRGPLAGDVAREPTDAPVLGPVGRPNKDDAMMHHGGVPRNDLGRGDPLVLFEIPDR